MQIGPYAVDAEIGRGGMGIVYRATDPRLGRAVAIKALPEHFADDPDRLGRFEREARTLAALNHPNIAGIHGLEEHDGRRYLVLELVEGETLAERLDRGPLALDEALEVCAQIGAGVEAAHEAGVIHRDLKPGNVKITPEGRVKVLDFGLAKSAEAHSSSSVDRTHTPTMTTPASPHSPTAPGAILGTAPYMSPEQARGRPLDRRSDIWSFGVILYECLTGVCPFVGETATDSIGAILHKDVEIERLPRETPRQVRHVLARCLERDKSRRLRDIGDARIELEAARAAPEAAEPVAHGRRAGAIVLACAAGLAVGGAAVGLTAAALRPAPAPRVETEARRFSITLPPDAPLAPPRSLPFAIDRPAFDISADGRRLVYAALVEGGTRLYLHDLTSGLHTPLPGTDRGFYPFFSPDGASVAFFADERMLRIDIGASERARVLADAPTPWGGYWARDGHIYFTPSEASSVMRTPESGGVVEPASSDTTAPRVGYFDAYPFVTRDGRSLYYSEIGAGAIHVMDLESGKTSPVVISATETRRAPLSGGGRSAIAPLAPGDPSAAALLFTQGDRLMVARLDENDSARAGELTPLIEGIRSGRQWALADDGTLVYARGRESAGEFVWIDRQGARESLGVDPDSFVAFSLSPDGRRLATPVESADGADVWVIDLDRPRTPRRITFEGYNNHVIWSPDGRWILFVTYTAGSGSVIRAKDLESRDDPVTVYESDSLILLHQYDDEPKELLFSEHGGATRLDLQAATLDLSAKEPRAEDVRTISATEHHEVFARVSPDRRWLAYNSDETGRWEVYVASYPDLRNRVRVSSGGGEEMQWSPDGSRIVYRWGSAWYESEIAVEPTLAAGPPREIFSGPFVNVSGISWDASNDWERFIVIEDPEQERLVTTLEVITGFDAEIRRRVAPDR